MSIQRFFRTTNFTIGYTNPCVKNCYTLDSKWVHRPLKDRMAHWPLSKDSNNIDHFNLRQLM